MASGEILSWNGVTMLAVAQSNRGGSSNIISLGNTNVTATDTGSDLKIISKTEGTGRWAFTSAGHLFNAQMFHMILVVLITKYVHLFLSDNSLKFVDPGDVEYPTRSSWRENYSIKVKIYYKL